jgi:hypothetical protein
MIKKSGKMRSYSKADLIEIIKLNLYTHTTIENINSTFNRKELDLVFDKYKSNITNVNIPTKDIYTYILKNLVRDANIAETTSMFSVIFAVNKVYIGVLNEIEKNLDKIMENDTIDMFNSRVSHVAVFGILQESEIFGIFTTYLYRQISIIASNAKHASKIQKYRSDYMLKTVNDYVTILNTIFSKTGKYNFMHELDKIKRTNLNTKIYSDNMPFTDITNESDFTNSNIFHLNFGIRGFSVFNWLGTWYIDWKHKKYEKNKDLKEWMEAHNALLKLELSNVSEDSPEYQRQLKIIDYWDDKISKLDRDINEYLNKD